MFAMKAKTTNVNNKLRNGWLAIRQLPQYCMLMGLLCVGIVLSGCSHLRFPAAFKIDVAQGNILELDKVQQLQPGMTQRQVLYLLGSPVMKNRLQPNIWNYVYQFSDSGEVPKRYSLQLHFDETILRSIDGDLDAIKAWHKANVES